ncbi:monovalent cation/H+ antiporter subunit D [Salinicola aestuarinus]|uniref:monovalent cation/H+ antiporter subunit D n=1 Tax=Salinicola aestuarinus TaxID=1949082 RepID=UPI000DA169B3|nr:monovalent cation/H+ antiporter subunit D [Salinicola aestuarinus]
MMQHLIVLPVLLPLLSGLLMLVKRDATRLPRRGIALVSTLALVAIAVTMVIQSLGGEITYYALGDWQPPFGIILVLDRLSALMVCLTSVLALGSVLYACAGDDRKGSNFHGLFQLQLMGINGAFLTGDLFNLFVFFEVLLIASYSLLMHGGGKDRTQAGFHYVALNLAGSAMFLIALGVLYGTLGTLNMADMSQRVSMLDPDRLGLVKAGAFLLLVVFGLKAAILPLYFWLPRAYASAPAPVAALFAIMTKVGIYGILRVYTLIFGEGAGELASFVQPWLWWFALATLALGGVGVLSSRDLRTQVAYLIIISVGTLLVGVSMNREAPIAALLYYMIHTTLVSGGLFLLADAISEQRGKAGARIVPGRGVTQPSLLGFFYFLGAVTVIGLPPLSGAIGKALLLDSAQPNEQVWLWPLLLLSSLAGIVAMGRSGSTIFWKGKPGDSDGPRLQPAMLAGLILLLGASPVLSILAGPITAFTDASAAQLLEPGRYVQSILAQTANGGGS